MCKLRDNGLPLRLGSVFGRIRVRDPIHDAVSEGEAIDGLGKTPIVDQVCVIVSQARQENFSRTCWITFH